MEQRPSFQYSPEIDYTQISAEDVSALETHLDPFKKGILKPLEAHLLNSDGLRKYLASAAVTGEIRAEYRFKESDVDDAILSIQRAFSELEMDLQERQLETVAQRDYYNVFQTADIDNRKMEFMLFLKTYESLKKFNLVVLESWGTIREVFESIKVQSYNSLFLEQVLSFKVYPRIELGELTDLLLRRMAHILQVRKEEIRGNRVHAEGIYSAVIRYTFSTVFQEDLEFSSEKIEVKQKKETKVKQSSNSCIKSDFYLDSRGTEIFNQGLVYTMELDEGRVRLDEKKIRVSVYVETHLGAEEAALRQDLIRKFISQARKKNKAEEYRSFLFTYFDFVRDTLLMHSQSTTELQKVVFMYHFSPVYFFRLIMHFMKEGRTGYIHRHLKKEQMVRELPFEYIKYILKDWWDEKVFQKLSSTERNSRELYIEVIRKIKSLWATEQPRIMLQIQSDPLYFRAFKIHDLKALATLLQEELSYMYYFIFNRFLGPDFLYVPIDVEAG